MRKLKLTKLKKTENNHATDKDVSDAKNMIIYQKKKEDTEDTEEERKTLKFQVVQ